MGKQVRVGNLPESVTYQQLRDLFSQVGEVVTVSILDDHSKRQSPDDSAIVDMVDDDAAQRAVSQLDGKAVGGRKITVADAGPATARYTSPSTRDDQGGKPSRP